MAVKYYLTVIKREIFFLRQNLMFFLSSKKKAVYIGCTDKGNSGDEGVLNAIQKLLGSKIFIYPISYNAPTSGKLLRKIFFKSPDFIILGGGTIIKKRLDESYLKLFNLYHKKYPEAKLVVFGSGVADPELAEKVGFPTGIDDWRIILEKCAFIGVRGVKSEKILKESWKIKNKISVIHDPAIFYQRDKFITKNKDKSIGMNFCNIIGRIYGLNQKKVEIFAKSLTQELLNLGWKITLFPTTPNDEDYMISILGEQIIDNVKMFRNFNNVNRTVEALENMDIFVGMRLHSLIFASCAFTPFYGIEYESKTTDFLYSLGLENSSQRTDELDVKHYLETINRIYNRLDEEQQTLFYLMRKANKKQMEITNNFLKSIE